MSEAAFKVRLVARWRKRPESVEAVTDRLWGCLRALGEIDPEYAGWRVSGPNRRDWIPLPMEKDLLTAYIVRLNEKLDRGQPTINWGCAAWAGAGDPVDVSFSVVAEGPKAYPMDLGSNFALTVWRAGPDPLDVVTRLIPILVEHWDPEVIDISRDPPEAILTTPWLTFHPTVPSRGQIVAALPFGWLVAAESDHSMDQGEARSGSS